MKVSVTAIAFGFPVALVLAWAFELTPEGIKRAEFAGETAEKTTRSRAWTYVANPDQITHSVETIPNDNMDPLFAGVVQATEEAIVNALIDNQSMTGRDNHHVDALPHDRVRELLKKYNRLQ